MPQSLKKNPAFHAVRYDLVAMLCNCAEMFYYMQHNVFVTLLKKVLSYMKNKQIAFPICAYTLTRKRSKQVALKCAADVCLYFKVHFKDEMRRLYINTEKKQADCLSDSRRRMLILQANRGGEMRCLFFVLLIRYVD